MAIGENQPKILIVDDVPSNIDLLHQAMGEEYEVLFATNGRDALAIAATENPDLILLDVMMPEMDGYQVCRRLKAEEHTRHIPVIFVTALNDEADETRGLNLGAIDYLTKPISVPILQARVRNHLELKKRGDLLERLAMMDGLTGIPNRRRFDETLEREWRRCLRAMRPLSLIIVDIDHFKLFNDHYGHALGDQCLKKIASALARTQTRSADLVARYGGEEFVCLLPEIASEGAQASARRMHEAVTALRIPHKASPTADHVTLSLGVATIVPSRHRLPTCLIEAADGFLYQAKHAGRNQQVFGFVKDEATG
ncbi:MAG: PleD family two-component system response regulator [Magnetococcus sp. DMHC-1]|nr:PleD family two-component system response regulator [Magnetococcales bacterium]